MKRTGLFLLLFISFYCASSQMITATKPARLQVYAMKADGSQALMTSDNLEITYDQLVMQGELDLNTLQTIDKTLLSLLDSAAVDKITFSGMIPEGKFEFGDAIDEQFSVETRFQFGDRESRIILEFTVSNRKTSVSNTFAINCTGSISLGEDLGLDNISGLSDQLSFQFSQNIQSKSY
jgi:hypothetical protein